MTLKLQTWGGIGDILRELSLLPLARLHERFGIRFEVCQRPASAGEYHPDAECPEAQLVEELVARLPQCRWGGVRRISRYDKGAIRFLRRVLELPPIRAKLFNPDFRWRDEDSLPQAFRLSEKNLVVQTHLRGLPSKRWPIERWQRALIGIRDAFPNIHVHVLDTEGSPLSLEGVTVHDRLSIPQAIRLTGLADWVVSIDSWTKYVAAWHRTPQVIIVPDQRGDYSQLQPDHVWRHSFRGLQFLPEIFLLGLTPLTASKASYSGDISSIDEGDVSSAISALIERFPSTKQSRHP